MLRLHQLNCGTLHPPAGRLLGPGMTEMGCRCLLVETPASGLVLVDSGIGRLDLETPMRRLGQPLLLAVNPALDPAEPAADQLARMGHDPTDVRHIVLTHLDMDHAGGLNDFPWADVHLLRTELEAALHPATPLERQRYRPTQWTDEPVRWRPTELAAGERWNGLEGARRLEGLPPEILLLPLPGHTRGHAGVAIQHGAGWLLHVGDAYTLQQELRGSSALGVRLYHRLFDLDTRQRRRTLDGLRRLAATTETELLCSHDPG